jgi:DNA-binding CsgD family transcriptional regulator/tetratricopeptide (TPR) repeat protein
MFPLEIWETAAFVGRDREFNALKSALTAALSGRGRVIVLVGEPGIGKTRTAQELVSHAEALGIRAIWGRCYEGPGAPSYWPWIQAIRAYLQDCDKERLRSELGVAAPDIAEVVPEVRQAIPDLEPPGALDPEQARFRFFDSVSTFLQRASRHCPLMIVLDDLHWADRPSLLLLEFLAQSLQTSGVLILGTCRDIGLSARNPLVSTLGGLNRQPNFLRIPLGGVDRSAIRSFVSSSLGSPPTEAMVRELYARSQGNPLFLTEMVRLLLYQRVTSSGVEKPGRRIPVPEGVREVIHRRLELLSQECCQVLTVASVVGNEFDLTLMGLLLDGQSHPEIAGLIEEAVSARVIEELPDAVGRYRFTHVLIQETLATELSSVRRASLHLRIAESIERMYGSSARLHAAEIAHHLAQAAPFCDGDLLARYSVTAGEQALTTYAYEDAVDYFQQALAAKNGGSSSSVPTRVADAETAAILFGLGKAQGATGLVREAWASLERAFDFYFTQRDIERCVEVSEYPLFFVPGLKDTTRMASQALTLVRPDSLEAGRLLARYGMLLNLETGDYHRSQEALEKALLIAEREGDALLEIQTLTNAADVDWYHTRWEQVIRKAERAIGLARSIDNLQVEIWPHILAATSYWSSTPGEKVAEHIGAALDLAEKVRNKGFLSMSLTLQASLAQSRGQWETAREILQRCLALSPDFFYPLCRRIALEFDTGNYEEGEAFLERLLELMRKTPPGPVGEYTTIPSTIAHAAYVSGDFQRFDIAREAAEVVLSSPGVPLIVASDAYIGLAYLAVLENDQESAKKHYDNVLSLNMVFVDDANTSIQRLLGLLAKTMGKPQTAATHFEDAIELCRDADYRPQLAWVCYEYASLLLEGGPHPLPQPLDRQDRGASLLQEGRAIAEALGMKPLLERITSLQERISLEANRDLDKGISDYPDGLTQREVDVLRLVAAGKSNQQIADELFISVHTVIYHVRNIFSKTGASNRTEAASYAVQRQLV